MLTIGEVARRGGVSVRVLRHYDEIGLFVPAAVDPDSGYRYYSEKQVGHLRRIVALKDLGFGLEQIRTLLLSVSVEGLVGMLTLRGEEIRQEVEARQRHLAAIDGQLRRLQTEREVAADRIVVCSVRRCRVAAIGTATDDTDMAALGDMLERSWPVLSRALDDAGVRPVGDALAFSDGRRGTGDRKLYAAVPVGRGVSELPAPVEVLDVPAIPQAATTLWVGPLNLKFLQAHRALMRWIEEEGYEIVGPRRDVFVNAFRGGGEVSMKIHWPVGTPGEPRPDLSVVAVGREPGAS